MSLGEAFDSVLAGAKQGSESAWAAIYRDLVGPVTGYLTSRSASDPDDLASETFLHVAKGIDTFSGGESEFRSWVFVIAHRRLQDERRRRSRRILEVVTDSYDAVAGAGGDVETEALDNLVAADMRRIIDGLPVAQRDVLILRVVAGLSIEQTAHVLGKKPGAVKVAQHRAVVALRELMGSK